MDPRATWRELKDAYRAADWSRVSELAEALLGWLEMGGFPPETADGEPMGEEWDRAVARAAAESALRRARPGEMATGDVLDPDS
jgi:hypothetical protein